MRWIVNNAVMMVMRGNAGLCLRDRAPPQLSPKEADITNCYVPLPEIQARYEKINAAYISMLVTIEIAAEFNAPYRFLDMEKGSAVLTTSF
jgi:hypothetical protein